MTKLIETLNERQRARGDVLIMLNPAKVPDLVLQVHAYDQNWDKTARFQNDSRLYVSLSERLARVFGIDETMSPNGRTFGEKRGEDKAMDRLWDRFNKRVIEVQSAILDRVINQAMEEYRPFTRADKKFSRHAGCTMCSCSPGWIAGEALTHLMRNWMASKGAQVARYGYAAAPTVYTVNVGAMLRSELSQEQLTDVLGVINSGGRDATAEFGAQLAGGA